MLDDLYKLTAGSLNVQRNHARHEPPGHSLEGPRCVADGGHAVLSNAAARAGSNDTEPTRHDSEPEGAVARSAGLAHHFRQHPNGQLLCLVTMP